MIVRTSVQIIVLTAYAQKHMVLALIVLMDFGEQIVLGHAQHFVLVGLAVKCTDLAPLAKMATGEQTVT